MAWKRFRGGIFPLRNEHAGKPLTENAPVREFPAPDTLSFPMLQHLGAPCAPLVKKGDRVLMGQRIGEPKGLGAPIHASVSGVVEAIDTLAHVAGGPYPVIRVRNDHLDERHPDCAGKSLDEMTNAEIADAVFAAGIVGLGGATFPTHIKLKPNKPVDTIVLNGAECEPYLTADHRVMVEQPEEFLEGIRAVRRVLAGERAPESVRVVLGLEENKVDVADRLRAKADEQGIEIALLPVKYPQGSEKHLIYATTGRVVALGALPADAGCTVFNVATVTAIAHCITTGMPLVDRVVTVSGPGIERPANLRVRLGTLVSDLIQECGIKGEPGKVLLGGPMMGFTIYDLATPVIKGTGGITVQDRANLCPDKPTNCIRCGNCVTVCPMNLMPLTISAYGEKADWEMCDQYNARACIECGSCSFICPAHRPLTPYCRLAKKEIAAMRARERSKA